MLPGFCFFGGLCDRLFGQLTADTFINFLCYTMSAGRSNRLHRHRQQAALHRTGYRAIPSKRYDIRHEDRLLNDVPHALRSNPIFNESYRFRFALYIIKPTSETTASQDGAFQRKLQIGFDAVYNRTNLRKRRHFTEKILERGDSHVTEAHRHDRSRSNQV